MKGMSRGFGFVTFEDAESANQALRRQHLAGGRRLECKKAKPKTIFGDFNGNDSTLVTKKLFVGGLIEGTTEDEIKEAFGGYGRIVDVVIFADRQTDSGRCFAFVNFDSPLAIEGIMQDYYDVRVAGRWVVPVDLGRMQKGRTDQQGASDEG